MDRFEFQRRGVALLGSVQPSGDPVVREKWLREVDEEWRKLLAELDEQHNPRRMEAMG